MSEHPRTLTRRPRYGPFLLTGVVVGVVVTLVVVLTMGRDGDARRLAFYLGILFAGTGALLGGGLAVWLERHDDDPPVD